jgi:hypothetical protein
MGVSPYSEADGMLVRRFLTPHDEAAQDPGLLDGTGRHDRPPRRTPAT